MGMDVMFTEKVYKDKRDYDLLSIIELRGYEVQDILVGGFTGLESWTEQLPEIVYKKIEINEDDPGYDTYWLSPKTVENYKTIIRILKDNSHCDDVYQLEKLVVALDKVFINKPDAEVYMDFSF